jgi:hypothetical protein
MIGYQVSHSFRLVINCHLIFVIGSTHVIFSGFSRGLVATVDSL